MQNVLKPNDKSFLVSFVKSIGPDMFRHAAHEFVKPRLPIPRFAFRNLHL
jgi:hypothetical protein